jgi:hypothetical protein
MPLIFEEMHKGMTFLEHDVAGVIHNLRTM